MGCDIHVIVEEKQFDQWIALKDYYFLNRNYCMFALLADVRNNSNVMPFSKPKGIPDDASLEVKEDTIIMIFIVLHGII